MTAKHRAEKGKRSTPPPTLSRRRLLGHAARAAALLAPGLGVVERASAAPATPLLAAAGPRQAPAGTLRVALSDIGSERFDPRIDSAGSQLVWAEIFEPPCVAFDLEIIEDATRLAAAGADFVALKSPSTGVSGELARWAKEAAHALAAEEDVA